MSFGAAAGASLCPCGSGVRFAGCCGPLLAGEPAPGPERLMRSRYTAFARGDAAHLERTWHPRTRPGDLRIARTLEWTGLEILEVAETGDEGVVEFRASWRDGADTGVLHERSRFTRRGGRWLYIEGEVSPQ